MNDPNKRTTRPILTGTSVLGIKFDKGVLIAADTLGSYGSTARFTDLKRIIKVNNDTIVGISGDISDLQEIEKYLERQEIDNNCFGDNLYDTPKQTFNKLSTLLYSKRNKMNPLWNDVVVGGFNEDDGIFLGTSDKIGTHYVDDFIATGFGMHLCLPIMRERYKPDLTEEEAREILKDCMRVLIYRDCRALNSILFAKVDIENGVTMDEPIKIDTKWDYNIFIKSNTDLDVPY